MAKWERPRLKKDRLLKASIFVPLFQAPALKSGDSVKVQQVWILTAMLSTVFEQCEVFKHRTILPDLDKMRTLQDTRCNGKIFLLGRLKEWNTHHVIPQGETKFRPRLGHRRKGPPTASMIGGTAEANTTPPRGRLALHQATGFCPFRIAHPPVGIQIPSEPMSQRFLDMFNAPL